MKLDLRRDGGLSEQNARLITAIEPGVREEYNALVGELARLNHIDGLGWLTQASCRNTYVSQIHDRLCRAALLEQLLEQGARIEQVLVDDADIAALVRQVLKKHAQDIPVQVYGRVRAGRFSWVINLLKSLYILANLWFWPRIVRGRRVPDGEIIYLDNAIFIDSFDHDGRLRDRYYPGLIENTGPEKRQRIWYAPTLIGLRNPLAFHRMFRLVRAARERFLLMEDWLTAADYLFALWHALLLPGRISQIPNWRGYDVSGIVRQETRADRGSISLAGAILRYRFFRRLSDAGIRIGLAINWFENRVFDRALNLGLKKWYPDTHVKGYQGFAMGGYYASLQPTSYERKAGTLPDEVCVIGSAYVENCRQFCPELEVTIAPAFRFEHAIEHVPEPGREKSLVLLALPISIDESRDIIRMCGDIAEGGKHRVLVRQHPSYTVERFVSLVPEAAGKAFEFTDRQVHELYDDIHVLVSTASSVCMEAINAGVSVVVAGRRTGPTVNPLAGYVDERYWSVCYSPECVNERLETKVDSDFVPEGGTERYFQPVTAESVRMFVNDPKKSTGSSDDRV